MILTKFRSECGEFLQKTEVGYESLIVLENTCV